MTAVEVCILLGMLVVLAGCVEAFIAIWRGTW